MRQHEVASFVVMSMLQWEGATMKRLRRRHTLACESLTSGLARSAGSSARLPALLWALPLLLTACVVVENPPAVAACDDFATFLSLCTATCNPTWDCDGNFVSLPLFDQDRVDLCSICLADGALHGFCSDCALPSYGVVSCQSYMEGFLGVNCW